MWTARSLSLTLAFISTLMWSAAVASAQPIPVREVIVGEGQRASPTLSPGIRVGNILFASGQLGMASSDTSIAGQTTQALANLERVFRAAGTTLANAVKCTVFLTDVDDFQGMNQIYTRFFPANPPARTTVAVAALVVPDAKVEIECMGMIP